MKLAFIKKALVVIAAFALSSAAWAKTYTQSATTNGRKWWYYLDGSGNAIIEHENTSSSYTAAIATTASGHLNIPSSLDGHAVVGIGSRAFYACAQITGVTIPSGVKSIDSAAFYNCNSLETVNLPSSLEDIFPYAFGWCIKLESITIPNKVIRIGAYAFTNCWKLEDVTIPNSVATIGNFAFENCTALEEVAIPGSVTYFGDNAFKDCTSLELVKLPVSLTAANVKTRCFSGCSDDLTIASAQTVGGLAWNFRVVDGGAELCWNYDADESTIPDTTSGAVVIPNTLGGLPVVGIGEDAFYDCDRLTSVTIPASVTSIGENAFEDCERMALTVPDTVATIGDGAFKGCDAMADANGFVIVRGVLHHYTDKDDDVTIPEGVTRIGTEAFRMCTMDSVAIPATVTSIGASAFEYCQYLEDMDIPASVTSIESRAFFGCYALADKDGFVIFRDVLYFYAGDAGTVTIPGGVTEISALAFANNDDLENIVIPASVTSIGASAFAGCDYLTVATIPSGVATIGILAFADGSMNLLPTKVHVGAGDTARVKTLLTNSRHKSVNAATFIEDVPAPCVVAFDANGGAVSPATRLVTKGATVGNLPEPVRPGFVCDGWFTAAVGGEQISSALVVNADATYYAHWTEIAATTWFTKRADAFAEARRTGKKVFMICGRDTCGNTMYTKNVACEDPTAKAKLIAKCVLWYTNCDTQENENIYYWPGGSFALPVVCVIDPANDKGFLVRKTGLQEASDIIAMLADIPYPSSDSAALDPETIDPMNPGDLPWYKVINARDIWDPVRVPKAVVLRGAAYYGAEVMGVVELKLGKLSKNGTSKVSGSLTTLAGKKYTLRAQSLSVGSNAGTVYFEVRGLGGMWLAVGSIGGVNVFSGSLGKWHVQSASVGGDWKKAGATAKVTVGDVSAFGGTVLVDLLPTNVTATVTRGKWAFAKAASVKYAKPKSNQPTYTLPDATGKALIVDTSKGKTNVSGTKLTYTPKTGMIKGSFKVFAMSGTRLMKYTMNVTGVVIDGVGQAKATCKRPAVTWSMTVE